MARIAGVELPPNKKVWIGLTAIYGIGRSSSQKILKDANVNPDTRVRDLTEDEINRLRHIIESNYKIEGDLRREISGNISRLISIGCYRGIRHKKGLPVRGQRTRCNARTRKGPRRTVGRKKKKK
ncbi:30S ribosomal protein S13 [Candidatus Aerophobetes bacterium]|uniref:Small ribosomal subunit protein uS13 n=1 Tax=Aerophobetes bacterium TaxID=2030807 RepID=A0A662DAZ1_UNCAE|nr:30S ribosomal protein S13 [Candidatus Aerophobetes bacterium]RLE12028.1 MAG: 30S ribosomal protein S13 [Candidatus Aerophobetes bacterium]HDN84491.1 30S ribosomal protein S13 [Candidatus Aerophobetes bacterium]